MNAYLIDYDLQEDDDYAPVEAIIKKIDPTFWHHLDSTWIISSDSTADEITTQIQKTFPPGHGRLFVTRLKAGEDYKVVGFTSAQEEALKRKLAPKSAWDALRETQAGKTP